MRILDIGCGKNKYRGENTDVVIGLDKFPLEGVDVIWNLENTPLSFKDNEFDMIIANHILEHIKNFFPLMEEVHRITKPNGIIKIKVPFFTSDMAYTNPTHIRLFTYTTFEYLEPGHFESQYTKGKFKIINRKINFIRNPKYSTFNKIINPIVNKFPIAYQRLFSWILPCDELHIEMKVIK